MRLQRTLVATLSLLVLLFGMVVFARPVSLEARSLGFLVSAPDGSLYLIYDGVRHELEWYFGQEFVHELDTIKMTRKLSFSCPTFGGSKNTNAHRRKPALVSRGA